MSKLSPPMMGCRYPAARRARTMRGASSGPAAEEHVGGRRRSACRHPPVRRTVRAAGRSVAELSLRRRSPLCAAASLPDALLCSPPPTRRLSRRSRLRPPRSRRPPGEPPSFRRFTAREAFSKSAVTRTRPPWARRDLREVACQQARVVHVLVVEHGGGARAEPVARVLGAGGRLGVVAEAGEEEPVRDLLGQARRGRAAGDERAPRRAPRPARRPAPGRCRRGR